VNEFFVSCSFKPRGGLERAERSKAWTSHRHDEFTVRSNTCHNDSPCLEGIFRELSRGPGSVHRYREFPTLFVLRMPAGDDVDISP
jgi:hypothetical protein